MIRTILTALAISLLVTAAQAADPARGELLPGWREEGGRHIAGLAIHLAPGWKTYWRAPGEGGIPPRFNWSGSRNVAAVDVRYPVPKVINQNGLRSIGYEKGVVFGLLVKVRDPSRPARLNAEIEIGVCEEVCIPMTLRLAGTLPSAGSHDRTIAAALADQPMQTGGFRCRIEPMSDGLRLGAVADVPRMAGEVVVIETGEPGVWVSPAVTRRDGGRLMAEVEMVPPTAKPFALSRSEVRMTVIGEGRAVEMTGCR